MMISQVFNDGKCDFIGWKTDPSTCLYMEAHLRVKEIAAALVAGANGDPPNHHSQFSDANDHYTW
jgi:hypothetical protein